jgi:hypothetical protein
MFYCAIIHQLEIKFFLLLMEDILAFLFAMTRHGGMANRDGSELHSSCVKSSLELLHFDYFPTGTYN